MRGIQKPEGRVTFRLLCLAVFLSAVTAVAAIVVATAFSSCVRKVLWAQEVVFHVIYESS